jgi:DNA-directed RNA polymerase subunit RPC12/RpoP
MDYLCENCGGTRLEEIMTGVTQSSEITDVGEGGDISYNLETSAGDSGEVDRYQCIDCGNHVRDADGNTITDCDVLADRLEELQEARCFKISFTAQGHIEQTLLITNHNYTAREVMAMLKSGTAITSAQEDGDVLIVQSMTKIATIISSDTHLEYDDMEAQW